MSPLQAENDSADPLTNIRSPLSATTQVTICQKGRLWSEDLLSG